MSPKQKRFYPKKEKLKAQLPLIAAGKKTKMQAIRDAGYSESVAREQSRVLGYVGTDMQKALREAGFNEQKIATKIIEGMDADRYFSTPDGVETAPDFDVQHKFLTTGAKLLDVFPDEKLKVILPDLSDAELTRRINAAAASLAEEGTSGTAGGESQTLPEVPRAPHAGAQDSGGDDSESPSDTPAPWRE